MSNSSNLARPRAMMMWWPKAKRRLRRWPPRQNAWRLKPCCRARRTAMTPMLKCMPVPVARKARIGPVCCSACICVGLKRRAIKSRLSSKPAAKKQALSQLRLRLKGIMPMAGPRRKAACIGWCAYRPLTAMRVAIPALPACGVIRWSMTRLKSMSRKPMCG